ncbi:MAG: outer membrane protein transport protein [Saprospiraceae bacterium]|nr:outer membrane protein transport protein [Saprospiraceae bacterium]
MMKLILTASLLAVAISVHAQNFDLAEKFFLEDENATARSMGTAGAFGTVGADFSAATNNPAGMALFRKSEVGGSFGLNNQETTTRFLGQQQISEDQPFSLTSIGGVYSRIFTEYQGDSVVVRRTGLVNFTVAAGFNQRETLREQFDYQGFNTSSSLLTGLSQTANQFATNSIFDLDEFEFQAFDTNLLDTSLLSNGQILYSSFLNNNVEQSGVIDRTGINRTFYLSGGVNLDNKLYLGGTLGIPQAQYEETRTYTETDTQDNFAEFEGFTQIDQREYSTVGAYFHAGAIYKVNDFVRVGAHIKSPSVISVDETTRINTEARYNTRREVSESEDFNNTYNLTLPWKAGTGLVLMHPNYGLISLEADYVRYNATSIDFLEDGGAFTERAEQFNDEIDAFYQGAFNLRGGAEVKLGPVRLRGGYALNQSPYQDNVFLDGADYEREVIGAGIGFRVVPLNLTLDAGYNRITGGEYNAAYVANTVANTIIVDRTDDQFRLSLSKRF